MLDVTGLKTEDLKALSKGAVTELAAQLIAQLSAQQVALTAKDEHIGVVKRLWGFTKVRYRGLAKNTTRSFVALSLANLYLARRALA